jgi:RNA polymerase sigma-70 factor (ECF subfamily)
MSVGDETLIRQTLELKDTEAFSELVRRHQTRILLLQRRLTRDPTLAEDLCQDTFLRAWQKLHTYKGSGSFGGWLAALGYNVFLQHRRRHKRADLETELVEDQLAAVNSDNSALADLDRLLAVLDPEDQTILVLNYACGLTNLEVGEVMGMPAGTIKARIHRAKQKIQQHLAQGERETARQPSHDGPGTRQMGATTPTLPRKPGFFAQLTGAF